MGNKLTDDKKGREVFAHDEEEKRPWLSVIGLIAGILGWLGIFIMPDGENYGQLFTQAYIIMGIGAAGMIMSFIGRRRAPGMSIIGMIVGGALVLFMAIPVLVMAFTD